MQLEIPQFALLGHVQMQRIHLPWKMQCPVIRRVHFLRGEVITDEADTSSSATDYEIRPAQVVSRGGLKTGSREYRRNQVIVLWEGFLKY